MFEYSSTVVFESKLIPGAKFHLRKMSAGRRKEFNLATASILSEINRMAREMDVVDAEVKRAAEAAKLEPCTCDHPMESHADGTGECQVAGCKCREPKPDPVIGTQESLNKLDNDFWTYTNVVLFPAYIQWGVSEIEGYQINGQPATIDSMIAEGTEDVVSEVGNAIQTLIRMSPSQLRDFKWPTISGAQVAGPTSDSTAPVVEGSEITGIAIASSTTQN